jgi:glutathione synthase/RimK-type ligase-like ATP-grasp enzyme
MPKAVLFKSDNRFNKFKAKLKTYNIDTIIMDFEDQEWMTFDYTDIDFLIYFSTFKFSSNHPLALSEVYDNLMYIHTQYPKVKIFPDPNIIKYYNDKYKQFLFLNGNGFPIPETIPLLSEKSVDLAERKLGYPMVIKNRFGAGGGSVFRVYNKADLMKYYKMSKMDFFNKGALQHFMKLFTDREFFYFLIKAKNMMYPFFSRPILAQKFVNLDRDLKTVVGNQKVVEAHWRYQAHEKMWKVNIDDGGTGVWAKVPQEAIDLSVNVAKALNTSWINLDMIMENGKFLITEFSPVWHHYAYKEKPSFVYKDDYNIEPPLEISLDLERIIIESFLDA